MRRKFEELRENLEEFIQQDEYPMLVVGCLPEELAYVFKFFQGLEEPHPEHYLVSFPQPFHTPHGYLDGVGESIQLQVEAAGPLRAERGEPAFPPVPKEVFSNRETPEKRLFSILMYLRSLVPNEETHRVLVGLLPLECTDRAGYIQLLGSVMPVKEIPPWMGGLRLVAYDNRKERMLFDAMRANRVERVLVFEVDFSTPALTDSLVKDAANPTLPILERMTALFQLAGLDYSYKRYADALDKYKVLYDFYESMGVPTMQSFCLLGFGDVLRATGNLPMAKERYQQGIALAIQSQSLAPLINLLLSATEVCFDLKQYGEAASYAESGTKAAAAVLNPFVYCDFYERWGDALFADDKGMQGIQIYKKCQTLCEKYEYLYRWGSVLERQIKLFSEARMNKERRECEEQLLLVRAKERAGSHAHGGAP